MSERQPEPALLRDRYDAVLFDMDGVVTDTAAAHAAAWKRLFDAFLEERAARDAAEFRPFDANADYRRHVDGIPRYDGVKRFLESRGIELPFGDPDDDPDTETVCGLGNRKDGYFHEWLASHGARTFPGTLELIAGLRRAGVRIGIFSASRNADAVLRSAGIDNLFDARVDGRLMSRLGLPGKPDPAMLEQTADGLGVAANRSVIVEDAIAGVEAGRRGGFACVVGINRGDYADALREHGADLVVSDLSECRLDPRGNLALKRIAGLPGIWQRRDELAASIGHRRLAVLLDYDGTLTPIVEDYRQALLAEPMRTTLRALADVHPVAVISGRDLADVRRLVDLEPLYYSGSHGFELAGPGGWHHVQEDVAAYLPDLDRAEEALRDSLAGIAGHAVERKGFSIAVHYRRVEEPEVGKVEGVVDRVLAEHPRLVKARGKKVFELKPALHWDKGRAVELLLERLGLAGEQTTAFYVGDDLTDEAVFRVLRPPHVSIVIRDGDRVTAADYSLRDCEDVRRFLDWLSATAGGVTE